IIKVAGYLNEFKSTLNPDSLIFKALSKKLLNINKMLFQQFLYTDFNESRLKSIVIELKKNKLFPFKKMTDQSFRKKITYNILKVFINTSPILSRKVYLTIRK